MNMKECKIADLQIVGFAKQKFRYNTRSFTIK